MPITISSPTVSIRLSAIQQNCLTLKKLAPSSRSFSVIKANAYGHGLIQVAQALQTVTDGFAVARVAESIQLRKAGITLPILVLAAQPTADDLFACNKHKLWLTLHNWQALELLQNSDFEQPLTVWVKLDTGMHRLGFQANELADIKKEITTLKHIELMGYSTHFSSAEETDQRLTEQQIQQFQQATSQEDKPVSLANSAAIIAHPQSHGDWIRPGIALYGANPVLNDKQTPLIPAMTFSAPVIGIRNIKAGEGVGYNHIWKADKDSTIATIAAGYGDGYPRHATNGTPVLINGRRYPLAGRVSMDLITVDVTDSNVNIGDSAELWGESLPANTIAEHAGTIAYALFTGITERVQRIYC